VQYGDWACTADCAGECYKEPEPTGPRGYTIIDLGTLGGWQANAHAINNSGQVVGEADTGDGYRRAFLWDNGVMSDLGLSPSIPSPYSAAWGINNFRQIIVRWGSGYSSGLWENGVVTPLGGVENPQGNSTAYAINDAGQIVGSPSFLWENGVFTYPLPIGPEDINNLSQIAGSTHPPGSYTRAAVWDGEQIIDLGTLGGQGSGASAMNDLGQVIGLSKRASPDDRYSYAFLWQDGVMTDLSELAGALVSSAEDVNNCGELLANGRIYHPDYGFRIIRELIPAELRWYGLFGAAINDAGQIAGVGALGRPGDSFYLNKAFLLDPVPGDLAPDGAIDLRDFRIFQNRFSGASPPASGCRRGDLDGDGDVDLADFRLFEGLLTAPRACASFGKC
jgi:probable HAF family extracellular repeat protein